MVFNVLFYSVAGEPVAPSHCCVIESSWASTDPDIHQSLLPQAAELRAYLKSKGAEISEENSEGGLHVDLAQIIEACDVCLKEDDKGLVLIFVIFLNHKILLCCVLYFSVLF